MALITGQALRVRREIPHEPGQWVDIRPLSWKRLDEAKRAKLQDQAKLIGLMGGYTGPGGARDAPAETAETEEAAESTAAAVASNGHLDPKEYDRGMVLRAGLLAWSYGTKVGPGDVDLLDETTATWLAGEILTLHSRSEEERKND